MRGRHHMCCDKVHCYIKVTVRVTNVTNLIALEVHLVTVHT